MKKGLMTLGLGAGLMFLLDPDRGPRRRALVRDKFTGIGNDVQDTFTGIIRDLENRWYGIQAELESLITPEEVTDEQLVARVRSRLGRLVSHPRAIEVTAHDHVVTLSGPVIEAEASQVVTGIQRVRGVKRVQNLLEPHRDPDIPALQGWTGESVEAEWTPTQRILAGTAGGALALYGLKRGGIIGAAVALFGISMLTRGVTNKTVGEFMSAKSLDGQQGPAPRGERVPRSQTLSPSGGI